MKFFPLKYLTASFSTFILIILMSACNDESGNNSTTTTTPVESETGGSAITPPDAATPNDTSGRMSTGTKKKGRVLTPIVPDADANAKVEVDKQGYYNRTEILPVYKGGQNALENYITNNIEYPQEAIDNNVEGMVSVHFAVDEQGNISNVKTIGNKLGHGLEEEAVRVVTKMPKWSPGQVKGKNVKTWRTLPITYKLES